MIRRVVIPGFLSAAVALTAGSSLALGQAPLGNPLITDSQVKTAEAAPVGGVGPVNTDLSSPSRFRIAGWGDPDTGFLTGNRNFQNFIRFISNPVQSIDPRSSTEIAAMFGNAWISANDTTLPGGRTLDRSLLPSGNMMRAAQKNANEAGGS